MDLAKLSAAEAAEAIRSGQVGCEELTRACLDRIAEVEPKVQAWAHLDRDHALAQARDRHVARQEGRALGPLHGVPVGVKDVFDTDDMPTEYGSPLHSGRKPGRDATAVALLRQAGAVILGKTVTTEFAVYSPGKTTNPHDPGRTPGGSSSGSAAAVAAFMAPLAIGSQTNGSVIRPAAYCGVVGFKPTFGLVSRFGALRQSPPLDHVGVFARTVEDAALIAEVLMAYDDRDPAMRPRARPELRAVALEAPPIPPRLAFVKTPVWDKAEAETRDAFAELVAALGEETAKEMELPDVFERVHGWHTIIMEADLARNLPLDDERGKDRISPKLREMIESGRRHLAVDYNRAVEAIPDLNRLLDEMFNWFDAILTPATTGVAPVGLESTGSPAFCTIWTYLGMPAVTLPLLEGGSGMPLGVQLVGKRGSDARLLRTARWLAARVGEAAQSGRRTTKKKVRSKEDVQ